MYNNRTPFNQDLSQRDVSHVQDMSSMFYQSEMNHSISDWNVGNVTKIEVMFKIANLIKTLANGMLAVSQQCLRCSLCIIIPHFLTKIYLNGM